jgi:hypothetical protein
MSHRMYKSHTLNPGMLTSNMCPMLCIQTYLEPGQQVEAEAEGLCGVIRHRAGPL